jgi:hypothetical protein
MRHRAARLAKDRPGMNNLKKRKQKNLYSSLEQEKARGHE